MEYSILVVEDENGIRETISIFLENQGYHIFTAENGAQGLEIIHNNDIHLAVVDIMMPVMDGMTMVLKLREKYDIRVDKRKFINAHPIGALGYSNLKVELYKGVIATIRVHLSEK